jgi:hypothetical protein
MEELQVPTRRIAVELFTSDGRRLHGWLFAGESPWGYTDREEAARILNDERAFLPFGRPGREEGRPVLELLNKDHIVRVRLEAAVPEVEADDGSYSPSCTIVLSDGERLSGRLRLPTPLSASRLIDKLNLAPRFLPFATQHGVQLLHRDHVARVQ